MKIGKFEIKKTYKPSRVICDIISLAGFCVIIYMTAAFLEGISDSTGRADLKTTLIALLFAAIAAAILGVYAVLVLKSHEFRRYEITKKNAPAVYEWYAFSVSLIKLPALLIVFEGMLIFQQSALGQQTSLFNIRIILYFLLIAIIIRTALFRIKALTKKEKSDAVYVKAKAVEDNEEGEKK